MTSDAPQPAASAAIDLLRAIADQYRSYHDDKETMAYAAFALYAAAFGAVIVGQKWPPKWFLTHVPNPQLYAALILGVVFALAMLFVGWQLRNRRLAALRLAGAVRLAVVWTRTPPTDRDLRPWKPKPGATPWWRPIAAVLWPACAPPPVADLPLEAYPGALARYWHVQEKGRGTGARFHEHLIMVAMWVLLAGACARTLAG